MILYIAFITLAIIAGIALGYASDAKINEFRSSRMNVDEILNIIK